MNKIIVGVLAVLILGVGGYFVMSNQNSQTTGTIYDISPTIVSQDVSDDEETSENERYVNYTSERFEQNKNKRRVLFFYANWCPTCRPADADLMSNKSALPNDLVVFRVNYNDSDTDESEKSLAKSYGVTYQHTFIQVDAEGKEVIKWNGGLVSELLTNVK